MALMAASILPLAGLVGGALDMSRIYLVKTRLQQACDAGALAARRVMTGSSVESDTNANTQGQQFFRINFARDAYGTTDSQFVISDVENASGNTTGRVNGTATVSVPMTLMAIFDISEFDVEAKCEATLNIANNDIMFVLDLTGSMACLPTTPSANCDAHVVGNTQFANGRFFTTETVGSRIDVLRDAVSDFFATMDSATPDSARLRIGFVPYSVNVNVGGLGTAGIMPANSMVEAHTYRTRITAYTTHKHTPSTSTTFDQNETFGSAISNANCTKYVSNQSFTQGTATYTALPNLSGNPPTAVVTGGATPATQTRHTFTRVTATWSNNPADRNCTRKRTTKTTTWSSRSHLTSTTYANTSLDTTAFRAGTAVNVVGGTPPENIPYPGGTFNPVTLAQVAGVTSTPSTWDGCIEERADNANIDLLPTNEASRWRPAWRDVTFTAADNGSRPSEEGARYTDRHYSCTMEAQRLQVMTQAQVDAYVNLNEPNSASRFVAHGYTYHDIGMIWGARLMSLNGAFAADHTTPPSNGREVKRHIIFMTDGDMKPNQFAYGPYGIESIHKRVVGSGSTDDATLKAAHNARFAAACQWAKDNDISVWVVAFGQTLTTQLEDCADDEQAFQANSAAELNEKFQAIARSIAELRLSQ